MDPNLTREERNKIMWEDTSKWNMIDILFEQGEGKNKKYIPLAYIAGWIGIGITVIYLRIKYR